MEVANANVQPNVLQFKCMHSTSHGGKDHLCHIAALQLASAADEAGSVEHCCTSNSMDGCASCGNHNFHHSWETMELSNGCFSSTRWNGKSSAVAPKTQQLPPTNCHFWLLHSATAKKTMDRWLLIEHQSGRWRKGGWRILQNALLPPGLWWASSTCSQAWLWELQSSAAFLTEFFTDRMHLPTLLRHSAQH